MQTLLLALALGAPPALAQEADEPAEVVESAEPVEEPAPRSLAEVWAELPPEELLQAAIDRRGLGDVAGARDRLAVLEERAALPALTLYHLAICDELDEDFVGALAGYSTLIDAWPDLPLADDARYRRAIVLTDLGEDRDAALQIRELQQRRVWDERDALSMELVRGAAEVDAGRARRGVRRIQRALAELDGGEDLSWARARARMALARALLAEADGVEIVNDGRARKRLVARVGLLEEAMAQVIEISRLGEPEYALAGLLALGDAYLSLYDDLLAAPPPRGLDAEQQEIFQAELRKQVDVLQVKAWRFYDEGVSLATRLSWQGQVAEVLEARRAALGLRG